MTSLFSYDPQILTRYPAVAAGVVHASGLPGGESGPALTARYRDRQAAVREQLAATPVSEWPSIAAWRRAFTAFGAKPTQYRNAAEALLRRLDKQGEIPSLGALVDIGNAVSIGHGLPVAVFDLDGVVAPLCVRFAAGTETFVDLGSGDTQQPEPGEVVFADAAGAIAARRWCWRQSTGSATTTATSRALFVVEALHEGARDAVAAARAELVALLGEHQAGAELHAESAP